MRAALELITKAVTKEECEIKMKRKNLNICVHINKWMYTHDRARQLNPLNLSVKTAELPNSGVKAPEFQNLSVKAL
jgi:hypothetical protein